MSQKLNNFFEKYLPKSKDELRFFNKHIVVKHPDRNGNGDDVFNAKKVKTVNRETEHGYNPGSDEKVYEDILDEAKSLSSGVNHLGKSVFDKRDGRTGVVQNSYTNGSHSIKWKGSKEATTHDWHEAKTHIRIPTSKDEHKKYIKEDTLDELSAKTVDSYRYKAFKQQPAGDDGSELYRKRKAGRDMAFKKVTRGAKVMAKEDVIDRIIERFTPEDYTPTTDEDRFVNNLSSLSESQTNLLVNLFHTLNEDNRMKIINISEDRDNLPELVNFAIENLNELSSYAKKKGYETVAYQPHAHAPFGYDLGGDEPVGPVKHYPVKDEKDIKGGEKGFKDPRKAKRVINRHMKRGSE